jgi:hypothetical protein
MPSSGIVKPSSYLTGDTLSLHYRVQSVNAMEGLGFSRRRLRRMQFSGMLHRVALVRADVSEERITSIIRVTRIDELVFLRSVLR